MSPSPVGGGDAAATTCKLTHYRNLRPKPDDLQQPSKHLARKAVLYIRPDDGMGHLASLPLCKNLPLRKKCCYFRSLTLSGRAQPAPLSNHRRETCRMVWKSCSTPCRQ